MNGQIADADIASGGIVKKQRQLGHGSEIRQIEFIAVVFITLLCGEGYRIIPDKAVIVFIFVENANIGGSAGLQLERKMHGNGKAVSRQINYNCYGQGQYNKQQNLKKTHLQKSLPEILRSKRKREMPESIPLCH